MIICTYDEDLSHLLLLWNGAMVFDGQDHGIGGRYKGTFVDGFHHGLEQKEIDNG
jgi:hypothetical protein